MKNMAQLKNSDTSNIHLMLDSKERKLRAVLLNHLVITNRPFFPTEVMREMQDLDIEVPVIMKSLIEKGLILLKDDGRISGLYPISADPTRHRILLKDGRLLYGMCAIASLGIAFELAQDLVVSSSCSQCNAEILIEVVDGEISSLSPSTALALYEPPGEGEKWATAYGEKMDFLCVNEHLEKFSVDNSSVEMSNIYCLNIDDAGLIAKTIFGKSTLLEKGGKIVLTSTELLHLVTENKK